MEKLKLDANQRLQWRYDEEADVLYVSLGEPRPSNAIDLGNLLVLEHRGEITGVTIMNARRMLDRKTSEATAATPK